MKRAKILGIVLAILLVASQVFAAGSVVLAKIQKYPTDSQASMIVLWYTCTSDSSAGTLPAKDITNAEVGMNYYSQGYVLANANTISSASVQPTTGVAVTLADADGVQLIGSSCGDTLTPSTSASGVGYYSSARSASQREVAKLLTIGAIGSSIGNSKVYTLRLVFIRLH
jgi:hypothetical protein